MVYNMHERFIDAQPERVWELLATIGGDQDRLWPEGAGSFRLPEGLGPGAPVEHSTLRYHVGAVEPGHRLWFDTGKQLSGGHGFTLHPQRGGTLVRHELKGRTGGMFRLMWPLVIRRQHDIVIEKILDNLEHETAGRADPLGAPSPAADARGMGGRGKHHGTDTGTPQGRAARRC